MCRRARSPLLGARRTVPFTKARIELDRRPDRAALGFQPANEQGRGQETTSRFGHHPFGERQAATVGIPTGLEGRGAGPVPAGNRRCGHGGTDAETARSRTTDEPTEQRVTVEVRCAHPVDRSVGGDERSGARIADEPVVVDRTTAILRHLSVP